MAIRRHAIPRSAVMVVATALAASGALAAVPPAAATTATGTLLYASPNGSGSACTLAAPCTIQQAQTAARATAPSMQADVTVYLRGGTYQLSAPLTFTSADSGSGGFHVDYAAYPGETPAISGGQNVTGWTLTDSTKNIWSAPVPAGTQTRQLFIDGTRIPRASGASPVGLTQTATGYTASDTTLAGWRNPGDIEFVYTGGNGSWTEPRCDVAAISGTAITMRQLCWDDVHLKLPSGTTTSTPDGDNAWGGFPGLSSSAGPSYLENAYELLTPGHWYLDRTANQIDYIPTAGQTMAGLTAVIPTLQNVVQGNGTLDAPVQNLTFSGITFENTTWLQPSGDNGFAEMQATMSLTGPGATQGLCGYVSPAGSCPFAGWTKPPAAVDFTAAHNVSFTGDTFTHLGAAGLGLSHGSQNNLARGDEFTDISGSGVQLGDTTDPQPVGGDTREINTGNTITDSYVHGIGVEYHGAVGIWAGYTKHTQITHNQLDDLPYSGISMGWGGWHTNWSLPNENPNINSDNVVADNLVFNHMQYLRDGGAVYTSGPQGPSYAHGLTISGNVAYNDNTDFEYYNDEGGAYATISGNIAYHNGGDFNGGCDTIGYINVTGNYGNGATNSFPCDPTVGTQAGGNTVIPSDPAATDLPSSILSAAGLEAAYTGLTTRSAPAVAAANLTAGALLVAGSGFTPGATVSVAGRPCAAVTYLSSGYLTAIAPSGVSQGDVTVTTAAGTSAITPADHVVDTGESANMAPLSTAVASNTYQNNPAYDASKAIDGNSGTRWATDFGIHAATLEVDLPGPVLVNQTVLQEDQEFGHRIQAYTIDYWNGSAWVTAATGGAPPPDRTDRFPAVTTTKIRLNITRASQGPTINEFRIYSPNLALTSSAVASNTYQNDPNYGAGKAIDGDYSTRWATDAGVHAATLEVDLPFAAPISRTVLTEDPSYRRIQAYSIDYWNGSNWVTAASGGVPSATQLDAFASVTTTKIRLTITQATDGPTVDEFQVK
jgi:hypothetical protein